MKIALGIAPGTPGTRGSGDCAFWRRPASSFGLTLVLRRIRDLLGTVAACTNQQLPLPALPSGGYCKLVDGIRQKISDLEHR